MNWLSTGSSRETWSAAFRAVEDEHRFEAVFQVPPTHRLHAVRSRSRGGLVCAIYWEHEEYDEGGRLIARYESFDETSTAGVRRTGWRKYDAHRRLVAEGIIP